ncbi:MAG: SUF system Fe-S cluster assembly protein [Bacteroidetes bacterium]|nr:SUF system Fe-S cluster assembly protein [Bacteroidota bacterium]
MSMANKRELELKIVETLRNVFDPEIPVNIYDLGMIYEIRINDEGHAFILMTLTSPNCPVADSLPQEVKEKINDIPGLTSAEVEITFEPPWSQDMMSEEAKLELGFL